MSKRKPQDKDALELFMQYNPKGMQQKPQNNQKINSLSAQLREALNDQTVKAMIQKLVQNNQKIPLEILHLNEFYPFGTFNLVQSQCTLPLMFGGDNILVCAPTATGKTVIMEMAILREIAVRSGQAFKILYLAPIRALCQQKVEEWSARYARLNVRVSELTGDNDYTKKDNANYEGTHIIAATPEKWDYYIRKQRNVASALSGYSLLLIDEVHCVGDEERGPRLEAVVTRLRSFVKLYRQKVIMRTVAVSATLPNIEDIAVWLEVKKEGLLTFKESDRSVPLEKHVLPYKCENAYCFEAYLNSMLLKVIDRYSEGKQTLVFCQTQKGTQQACNAVLQDSSPNAFIKDEMHSERLLKVSQTLMDKTLSNYVKQGVAFHNANLTQQDRSIIEKLFLSQDIHIVCTTTTLALGVNLPAHLVVIKSTLCYKGSKLSYQEYSLYEICQMMGRAGRPQFDDKGVVAIMTDLKNQEYYRRMVEGGDQLAQAPPLESYLGNSLPTLLNAEVGIGYISTIDSLMLFIRNSYYYVRQLSASRMLFDDAHDLQSQVDDMMLKRCQGDISKLNDLQLIRFDQQANTMESTEFGKEVARQHIEIGTIEQIPLQLILDDNLQIQRILVLVSKAIEYEPFKSKNSERADLNKQNKLIKWKLKGSINTPPKKIFVLLQAHINNLNLEWELKKQMTDVVSIANRVLNCFKKLYQINEDGIGFIACTRLQSYIDKRAWPDDPKSCLGQIIGLGEKLTQEIMKSGIKSFEGLALHSPQTLSEIINKNVAYSENILLQVLRQPSILSINVQSVSANSFDFIVTFKRPDEQKYNTGKNQDQCLIVLTQQNKLVVQKQLLGNEFRYRCKQDINDVFVAYKIYMINLSLVGANEAFTVQLKSFQGQTIIIESKLLKSDEIYNPQSNIDFDQINQQNNKENNQENIKERNVENIKENIKDAFNKQIKVNNEKKAQPIQDDYQSKTPIQQKIDISADKFSKWLKQQDKQQMSVVNIQTYLTQDNEDMEELLQAFNSQMMGLKSPIDHTSDSLSLSLNAEDFLQDNFSAHPMKQNLENQQKQKDQCRPPNSQNQFIINQDKLNNQNILNNNQEKIINYNQLIINQDRLINQNQQNTNENEFNSNQIKYNINKINQINQNQFNINQDKQLIQNEFNRNQDKKINSDKPINNICKPIKYDGGPPNPQIKQTFNSGKKDLMEAQVKSSNFLANLIINNKRTTEQQIQFQIKPISREIQPFSKEIQINISNNQKSISYDENLEFDDEFNIKNYNYRANSEQINNNNLHNQINPQNRLNQFDQPRQNCHQKKFQKQNSYSPQQKNNSCQNLSNYNDPSFQSYDQQNKQENLQSMGQQQNFQQLQFNNNNKPLQKMQPNGQQSNLQQEYKKWNMQNQIVQQNDQIGQRIKNSNLSMDQQDYLRSNMNQIQLSDQKQNQSANIHRQNISSGDLQSFDYQNDNFYPNRQQQQFEQMKNMQMAYQQQQYMQMQMQMQMQQMQMNPYFCDPNMYFYMQQQQQQMNNQGQQHQIPQAPQAPYQQNGFIPKYSNFNYDDVSQVPQINNGFNQKYSNVSFDDDNPLLHTIPAKINKQMYDNNKNLQTENRK